MEFGYVARKIWKCRNHTKLSIWDIIGNLGPGIRNGPKVWKSPASNHLHLWPQVFMRHLLQRSFNFPEFLTSTESALCRFAPRSLRFHDFSGRGMGGIQFSSSLKLKLSVCQPLPDIHPNSRKIDLPGFKWEKNRPIGGSIFGFRPLAPKLFIIF